MPVCSWVRLRGRENDPKGTALEDNLKDIEGPENDFEMDSEDNLEEYPEEDLKVALKEDR